MKFAVFETEQWEHDACLRLSPAYEVSCVRDTLDEASARLHAKADIISSFVYSQLDASVLAHFAQLRLIATRSTGYDHIDLGYCQSRGIIVCNVPGYGDTSVAEHVFALLLGLARKIADAAERTRRGRFDQACLRGFELKGRTIAVIGAGRIGMRVIEIARGFSMSSRSMSATTTRRRSVLAFGTLPSMGRLAKLTSSLCMFRQRRKRGVLSPSGNLR